MSERQAPPDGYQWIGDGPAIRLIDPTTCPAGHPLQIDKRGHAPCTEHRGHPMWTCACGQEVYRITGAFVDVLTCR
jgi:hypothetical protein